MFGIGKRRSRVGKFLDKHRYTQEEMSEKAKINRNTTSKLCNEPDYVPGPTVLKKVMKFLRRIDPNAKTDDFFDI
jgi:DNA-binding XRE family transcriptional regulator